MTRIAEHLLILNANGTQAFKPRAYFEGDDFGRRLLRLADVLGCPLAMIREEHDGEAFVYSVDGVPYEGTA